MAAYVYTFIYETQREYPYTFIYNSTSLRKQYISPQPKKKKNLYWYFSNPQMDHKLLFTPPKCLYTKYIITIIYFVSISHHINAQFITSCKQTPYPSVCAHHMSNSPLNTQDDQTDGLTFHDLVVSSTMDQAMYLHRLVSTVKLRRSLHKHATSALIDCLELYEDTIDQLNHSRRSYGQEFSAHDRQTSLSATIANQDTCRNGFKDFNLTSSYSKYFPIHIHRNLTKSLSNSLAVSKAAAEAEAVAEKHPATAFTKFSKQRGGGGRRLMFSDEKFPSWLPLSDRKLLEDSETTTKADLVVAKDGSGHYTSIQQAVNAAAKFPRRNKRLVIYVKAGVYRENVEIKKSIKNVMVIGDGIDSTTVTGNRNVKDGTTTFRSATFGTSSVLYSMIDQSQYILLKSNIFLNLNQYSSHICINIFLYQYFIHIYSFLRWK